MSLLIFISPPDASADPHRAVPERGLSDLGRRTTEAFARASVTRNVSAIWCSPARPAIETAAILSARRNVCLRTEPRLGDAGGIARAPAHAAELATFLPRAAERPGRQETLPEAQARLAAALGAIVAAHRGADLAIVSHGTLGALLRCHLMDRPICRDVEAPRPGFYWTADLATPGLPDPWRPFEYAAELPLPGIPEPTI